MVDSVIRSRQAGLIIVDSLAVMKPQETGGSKKGDMVEYGRAIMGQRAKNFDDFFAVVAPVLQVTKQTLLVVNQLRSSMNPMGDPFVEPGGDAKNYAYSLSVRLTKPDIVEVEDKQTHHVFNGYIKKNKVGGRRGAKFSAYFGLHPTGRVYPDLIPELCAIGKDMGVFTNAQGEKFSNGTWHYKGKALQIKDDVVKSLADAQRLLAANEDLRKEIELEIRKEIDRENFNDF
jgi:RecA/RadA recombinase